MTQHAPPPSGPAAPSIAIRGRFRTTEPVPGVITAAFWILVSGAALVGVLAIAGAVRVTTASGSVTPQVSVALIGTVIGGLIRIGIAQMLRRGYGPARGYLTAVGVLTALVVGLGQVDPINLLLLASVIVSIVLLWLPPASGFFRTVGIARHEAKAVGMTVGFLG